jgi:5-hydroxyisourate hydrolase-like protein (transthyretin family)
MSFSASIKLLASATLLAGVGLGQTLPTGVIGSTASLPLAQRESVKYVRYYGATVPVNGLGNYIFYYVPNPQFATYATSSQFQPTGSGAVEYLDQERNLLSVASSSVNYNPSAAYTETTTIPGHPFNTGGSGSPPGIFGFVTSDGAPRSGVTVRLYRLFSGVWSQVDEVKTNGNGFYIFYYTAGTNKEFLLAGTYNVGLLCSGYTATVQYQPNTPGDTNVSVNMPFSIPAGQCNY